MKRFDRCALALLLALLVAASPLAAAPVREFGFGVIAHAFKDRPDELALRDAIAGTDAENLAFVVANGIKSEKEPCSDSLYLQRRQILGSAKNGLILSLAGSDWIGCTAEDGQSVALERLNRLREIFFSGEFTLGESKLPVSRQSAMQKFRSYGENARWEVGGIEFATFNLPAENNHYLPAAGRNSEFEDRVIANRSWLQRIFGIATHRKASGIVLFFDGDPLLIRSKESARTDGRRDGYLEIRKEIRTLASHFHGQVLAIHGTGAGVPQIEGIRWTGNVGDLSVPRGWKKITVTPGTATVFALQEDSTGATPRTR